MKCADLYKPAKWCFVLFVVSGLILVIVHSIMQSTMNKNRLSNKFGHVEEEHLNGSASSPWTQVRTTSGDVTGTLRTLRAGRHILSFEGVPYAQPPVGPLRFKDPQLPPTPWNSTLRAWTPRKSCLAVDRKSPKMYSGDEDCLYLNIYTPSLDDSAAVMVWFGGGDFKESDADSGRLSPYRLVDRGVVLVSVQYRRGVLGFLSTGDHASPGNFGLKDQAAALRWVRDNIAAFGGDPARITIAGIKAGAACVGFHLLSPMSAGLFHRAIAMGGSALNPWAFSRDPYAAAKSLAEQIASDSYEEVISDSSQEVTGHSSEGDSDGGIEDFNGDRSEIIASLRLHSSSQLVAFLRKVPAERLVTSQEDSDQAAAFRPCAEPASPGAFLTQPPWTALEAGLPSSVPLITGAAAAAITQHLPNHSPAAGASESHQPPSVAGMYLSLLNQHFVEFVAPSLRLPTEDQRRLAAQQVRSFYFGDEDITSHDTTDAVYMREDMLLLEGVDRMARTVATLSQHPVYYYHHTYGQNASGPAGSMHKGFAADALYSPSNERKEDPNPEEAVLRDTWLTLLTEFVKTGVPNAAIVSWPRYSVSSPWYLELGSMTPQQDLLPARMDFWRTCLPPRLRI